MYKVIYSKALKYRGEILKIIQVIHKKVKKEKQVIGNRGEKKEEKKLAALIPKYINNYLKCKWSKYTN